MNGFEQQFPVQRDVRTVVIERHGSLRTAMSGARAQMHESSWTHGPRSETLSDDAAPHLIVLEVRDRRAEPRSADGPAGGGARRICVLSDCRTPTLVRHLSTKVDACLITDMPPEAFIDALKAIAAGAQVNDSAAPRMAEPRPLPRDRRGKERRDPDALSPREMDVARLVAEGLANKAIAARLSISAKTVEAHITHIMEKLGVSARTQVAAHLFRNGLA
jgi:DNA-binding NarL/FixJ family response regulator